jgi:hypothetical protein
VDYNECDFETKFLSVVAEVPLQIILASIVHSTSSAAIPVKYFFETFLVALKGFIHVASDI